MPSLQRAWQKKMMAAGRCKICGKPQGKSPGRCDRCYAIHKETSRIYEARKRERKKEMARKEAENKV